MKVGKTTFAVQAPRNLLLALERGYNAIANANAVDITKWIEIKQYLKQLEKQEVKDMFDTISIDTVGQMWDLCEQYVCAQNNVENILDIPYGKGYVMAKKEFEGALRKITMLGYGLILISHVDTKTEKTSDGTEVDIIGPALMFRAS